MTKYISKDAAVAEIERRKEEHKEDYRKYGSPYDSVLCDEMEDILSFLDTLEVKEVDLEEEYEEYVVDDPIFGNFITNDTMGMELAKHFFELGLKAQKGE